MPATHNGTKASMCINTQRKATSDNTIGYPVTGKIKRKNEKENTITNTKMCYTNRLVLSLQGIR